MKVYKVDFEPVYPVGGCLVICANDMTEAREIASKTLIHTRDFSVERVFLDQPKVIEFLSGEY